MAPLVRGDSAARADDPDEDTIELELGPQQLQSLSHAAGEEHPDRLPVEAPDMPPGAKPTESALRGRSASRKLRFRCPKMPFEAAAMVTVTTLTLASAAYRIVTAPTERRADASAYVLTSAQTPSVASDDSDKDVPVRFRNPFDPAEVFEFPPGTSVTAARESVANLLLQRGRARLEHRNATASLNSSRTERHSARFDQ